jgi:hypothetical protein
VTHGNTVIHGNGIELGGKAAQTFNLSLDNLAGLVQMGVARYKLCE